MKGKMTATDLIMIIIASMMLIVLIVSSDKMMTSLETMGIKCQGEYHD